ncbi:MAG: ABC transporter ATP-binding protein [Clostridia bacterium]|nr:ABC transporter ATP-binding protein [Clostridia bacterium]
MRNEEKKDYIIELKNVTKTYDGKDAVKNASFNIKRGEFVTFLGPSGCGKTTTLRMIAGFENPTSGTILFEGKDITNIPPYQRKINTVFQKYALFPHLNVFKNIAFGLKLKAVPDGMKFNKKGERVQTFRKYTKAEIKEKVNAALKMVDLEDYGHRSVTSLSGGQQQRVAIARAIVNEPEVLLLDEPLGALDLKMRKDMQLELMNMHNTLGITFIYVTHDQEEALTMSDKIIVMRDGLIQQIATPKTIYDEPANAFVADFIGESNILSGIMVDDFKVDISGTIFECVDKGFKKNEPVDVIIRPEDIQIKNAKENTVSAEVISCVFKGDHYLITVQAGENELVVHNTQYFEPGSEITLYIKPFDFHIMHKARIINTIETYMISENVVDICGGHFDCNSTLDAGTLVTATVDFDDVEITDDPEDGIIEGTVVSAIYKGSYYQCIVKTDDNYDFFVDTDYEWLKGDRVGINIPQDKIIIEQRYEEENAEEEEPVVVEETIPMEEDPAAVNYEAPVKRSLEDAAEMMEQERYAPIEEAPVEEEKIEEPVVEETPVEEPVQEEKPAPKKAPAKKAKSAEEKVVEDTIDTSNTDSAEKTEKPASKKTTKKPVTFERDPGKPRNPQNKTTKK